MNLEELDAELAAMVEEQSNSYARRRRISRSKLNWPCPEPVNGSRSAPKPSCAPMTPEPLQGGQAAARVRERLGPKQYGEPQKTRRMTKANVLNARLACYLGVTPAKYARSWPFNYSVILGAVRGKNYPKAPGLIHKTLIVPARKHAIAEEE